MWVTAVVVLLEALVLRAATRTFINIPGLDVTHGALAVVTRVARIAFGMAVPLAFVLLILLAIRLGSSKSTRVSAIAPGALVVVVVAGLFGTSGVWVNAVVLTLVGVLATQTVRDLRGWPRLPMALWVFGYVLAGVAQITDQLGADGHSSVSVTWLRTPAEFMAVVAFLMTPLMARRRLRSVDLIVGGVVAALMTLAALSPEGESATKTLLLWNLGWSGSYPAVVYTVAVGCLVASTVALRRLGSFRQAAALVFMAAASFGLFSSYQTVLFAIGLMLLREAVRSDPTIPLMVQVGPSRPMFGVPPDDGGRL